MTDNPFSQYNDEGILIAAKNINFYLLYAYGIYVGTFTDIDLTNVKFTINPLNSKYIRVHITSERLGRVYYSKWDQFNFSNPDMFSEMEKWIISTIKHIDRLPNNKRIICVTGYLGDTDGPHTMTGKFEDVKRPKPLKHPKYSHTSQRISSKTAPLPEDLTKWVSSAMNVKIDVDTHNRLHSFNGLTAGADGFRMHIAPSEYVTEGEPAAKSIKEIYNIYTNIDHEVIFNTDELWKAVQRAYFMSRSGQLSKTVKKPKTSIKIILDYDHSCARVIGWHDDFGEVSTVITMYPSPTFHYDKYNGTFGYKGIVTSNEFVFNGQYVLDILSGWINTAGTSTGRHPGTYYSDKTVFGFFNKTTRPSFFCAESYPDVKGMVMPMHIGKDD